MTAESPKYSPENDADDFVICDGVLTQYKGKGGDVTIPDDVTEIGGRVFFFYSLVNSFNLFSDALPLTSVTLPEGVTKIGESAFQGCDSLTSVTIPDSVTEIGSYAFEGCSLLTTIKIPNNVTTIGEAAFKCKSLAYVTIPRETLNKSASTK